MSLAGKVILITGASGDIGAEAVRSFLDDGARIAAVDRSGDGLDRLARSSGESGSLATFVADVTDEASVQASFAAIYERFGRIDGLVNAAGIEGPRVPIDRYPADMFRQVLNVNVTGAFLGMKHAIPIMLESGGGSIVNLSSVAGTKGAEGLSAYIASKHAVIGLTRTAALEWMRHGIRVNAVCPGPISGRMIDAIYDENPEAPSPIGEARRQAIPARRFGEPAEVAAVTAFLLSDAASYVNGACYAVDGGISAM